MRPVGRKEVVGKHSSPGARLRGGYCCSPARARGSSSRSHRLAGPVGSATRTASSAVLPVPWTVTEDLWRWQHWICARIWVWYLCGSQMLYLCETAGIWLCWSEANMGGHRHAWKHRQPGARKQTWRQNMAVWDSQQLNWYKKLVFLFTKLWLRDMWVICWLCGANFLR